MDLNSYIFASRVDGIDIFSSLSSCFTRGNNRIGRCEGHTLSLDVSEYRESLVSPCKFTPNRR